mgnify:CR=1 FL=1
MSRGNYMKELGMTPRGEIQENTNHTVIFNLRRNLDDCRNELIACKEELRNSRANNNKLIGQIKMLTTEEDRENGGGRRKRRTKRRRTKRRKSSKKRRRSRKKRTKR